ncbi:MAG: pallilysin-related adhesin [Spirochaetales bacterium]|nr:pallilysin-related adhesin [Spirochaetales bacterium]
MIKKRTILAAFVFPVILVISCSSPRSEDEIITAQTIIPGLANNSPGSLESDNSIVAADSIINSLQILIDREYRDYEILNINLDEDEIDEQIILASPLNEDKNVFRIYIADFDEKNDEYYEMYRSDIGTFNLNIASIECDDLTGDHLNEIIITGVDTKDQQVFEVFKLFPDKENRTYRVRKVFTEAVDGDFEIIRMDRGNDYKIDGLPGDSFGLEVQKKNPDDEKNLIVERFKWNRETNLYDLSSSEKVRISSLSNENLLNFYRGTSEDYINFLKGPWFKTKDLSGNATHNMNEIFQILPGEKTITFYSGDIQESFTWNENTEPVKYRHILSFYDVRNNFLTSMYYSISINIDSFESIQVKIRGNQRWGGTYSQLTDNLQKALTDNSRENLLLSEMVLKGLYKTNLNTEISFDSPEYILKEEGKETRGIFTIFDLEGQKILEMKELSTNGLTKEIRTYLMNYAETADDLRIIRTITLKQGVLKSRGITPESGSELHFEQIEKINKDTTDTL